MASSNKSQMIVIVDPYSTGGSVSNEFHARGYQLIALWTDDAGENRHHVPAETEALAKEGLYKMELDENGATVEDIAETIQSSVARFDCELFGVVCGGETGVILTDALSTHLGLRGNAIEEGLKDRRDKALQQELVRASGQRAVRQACGKEWSDVEAFCASEPMPVVVKPVESAGSDGVKLCHSVEDARAHFSLLMTSQRKAGADGAAVLVQEFLRGSEYVIDQVTRDGVHKTCAVWVYDKRAANGAAFVYYDMRPVACDSALAKTLIAYTRAVLDALKISNGATHSEVMMTSDGPCLVEVNCRCHGGNGAWLPLASRLTGGITQVGALADAFVDAEAFDALPDVPGPFRAGGCNPMFVSYHEGRVRGTPGFAAIEALASYVPGSLDAGITVGDTLTRTVDLFTSTGQCVLVHDDPEVVAADLATIRELEASGAFFTLEEVRVDEPLPPASKAERTSRISLSEFSESSWRVERAVAAAA